MENYSCYTCTKSSQQFLIIQASILTSYCKIKAHYTTAKLITKMKTRTENPVDEMSFEKTSEKQFPIKIGAINGVTKHN